MASPPVGVLFYEARAKPLSIIGTIQPGSYYQFYLTGTLTPANVYADGNLNTPLSQTPGTGGTTAASDGRLVPIYLNPAVTYRYQLYSVFNQLLEDVDPYIPAPLPTAGQIGQLLYPQTAAEVQATIQPSNFNSQTLIALMPQRFGAVGDGSHDDSTALASWLTVLGESTQQAYGYLPAGTYKFTSNLTIPANVTITGANSLTSIFKPTAAVTAALTTSSGAELNSFMIDGANTTNATGLLIAPVGPDFNRISNVWVQNFAGGTGVGVRLAESVGLTATRLTAINCNTNLQVQSITPSSLPTTAMFEGCKFRTGVAGNTSNDLGKGRGVVIKSGQQVTFRNCTIEANVAEGVFVQPVNTSGAIIQDLSFEDCWFENNWVGHIDTGTNVYTLNVDGSVQLGVNVALSNVHFSQGAVLSDRKSALFNQCLVVLEKVRAIFGFINEFVVTNAASLVYLKDDAYDRCGRFINNASNAASVNYPPYLPIINLGTGLSVLPTIEKLTTLSYSASMTPDMQNGNSFTVGVTNTSAFTINNPLNTTGIQVGKRFSVRLNNISASNTLGAVTWGSAYKTSFVTGASAPANNFSAFIEFEWDGTHMVECYHTTTTPV